MKRGVAWLVIALLTVPACGNGTVDAADTARTWYEAISQLDLTRIMDLTCAQQRPALEQAMRALGGGAEIDLEALREQFQIDVSGLSYEENGATDETSTVRITGVLKVTASGHTQEQAVDQEVPMVKESGEWRVCASALPSN